MLQGRWGWAAAGPSLHGDHQPDHGFKSFQVEPFIYSAEDLATATVVFQVFTL